MSSKEKAEREHKRKVLEQADQNRRCLEGKRRHEKLMEEQSRILAKIAKGRVTTGYDVRAEMEKKERENLQRSSDDFLNPLNPLSPISPISIWNADDHNKSEEKHHHSSNDDHHHSYSDDHHSSHDSSSDSSSYDSGCSSGGDSGGD